MGRILNAVLLTAMIIGAAITYDMKHRAEVESDRVDQLQADIASEKDALSLLNAEWSKLSQPGRLQELVQRYADHFKLAAFAADQSATLAEIPEKPVDPGDALAKKIAASE
jgi:hypothetical protein